MTDVQRASTYVCGVDIGGTFTDCVLIDNDGSIVSGKVPSTPADPVEGFLGAIRAAASFLPGGGPESVLESTALLLHGTTIGTNQVVERRGATVGLLATRGHGDAILIMRGAGRTKGLPIHDLINVQKADKPVPIVPRSRIREVVERIDLNGRVVVDLDEDGARVVIAELVALDCDAIAIALLWSFKNNAHEARLKELVHEIAPHVYVTASSDLLPKRGEYERTAGTVINCFLGPRMSSYLDDIQGRLRAEGYGQELLIMHSGGGVIPAAEAVASPVLTLSSGPVGGVVGSRFLGELRGDTNIITTDMGGTTFDVAVIRDGAVAARSTAVIEQYEYHVPMVDITSIGAGGGSIIGVDPRTKILRVGPESAGAAPGPVAYGRGGVAATVTDADIVLGLINPAGFLGGTIPLDAKASEAALEEVGRPLGLSAQEVAAGAVAIVELNMAEAIRQVTIQKGYDTREFTIFAFGGAGPTHAAGYARELGARGVVVPLGNAAAAWSAFGVASSDLLRVYESMANLTHPFSPDPVNEALAGHEATARAWLDERGADRESLRLQRSATMRYKLQLHTVEVPLDDGEMDEPGAEALVERFHSRYEAVFGEGAGFRGAGAELVSLKLVAAGVVSRPRVARAAVLDPTTPAARGEREIYWYTEARTLATAVYDGTGLLPGQGIHGPAVIELPSTTIVIPPWASATIDAWANVVIHIEEVSDAARA